MKAIKLRSLLLVALMLLSLVSCGKDETKDPNLLQVGEFELLYKGASIMKDYEGNDALVLTLDFTNNSKETTDYFWSIYETAIQNDTELEMAIVYLNLDTLESVDDSQYQEVAPGATVEVQTAFELADTTGAVEVTFEEMEGSKNDSITIDLATIGRDAVEDSVSTLTGNAKTDGSGEVSTSGGVQLRDWWNGDWYGWWMMNDCSGSYEGMDSQWWDICGTIDVGEDGVGTVTLWDEDYTESEPMVSASVSLSDAGTTEHGTMTSEGGWFTDVALEHADWIVDPGQVDYTDMIHIVGSYKNGADAFSYDIFLRPWGTYWDDVAKEDLPGFYDDWYLPLIEAGEPMPDSIG